MTDRTKPPRAEIPTELLGRNRVDVAREKICAAADALGIELTPQELTLACILLIVVQEDDGK